MVVNLLFLLGIGVSLVLIKMNFMDSADGAVTFSFAISGTIAGLNVAYLFWRLPPSAPAATQNVPSEN
jgi:hypothetical protein